MATKVELYKSLKAKLDKIFSSYGAGDFKNSKDQVAKLPIKDLQSMANGLSQAQKKTLVEAFGDNSVEMAKPPGFWGLVVEALSDTLLIILLLCGALSSVLDYLFSDEDMWYADGVGIWSAVTIIVFVTATTDWHKGQQFNALSRKRQIVYNTVLGDGLPKSILKSKIAVFDVIQVQTGDEVPIDALVLVGNNLGMNESSATGESDVMKKHSISASGETHGSAVILAGSQVIEGSATLLAVRIGYSSSLGLLSQKLGLDVEETPLQIKLTAISISVGKKGLFFAFLTVVLCILGYCVSRYAFAEYNQTWMETIISTVLVFIVILVVSIPEGLPLAVTIALAKSMSSMLDDNNYVRKLSAVETMGSVTRICSDKTGTLTKAIMCVDKLYSFESKTVYSCSATKIAQGETEDSTQGKLLRQCLADMKMEEKTFMKILGRNVTAFAETVKGKVVFNGSATEVAFLRCLSSLGSPPDKLNSLNSENLIYTVAFDSAKKYMTSVYKSKDGKCVVLVKGASERVLQMCNNADGLDKKIDEFATQALRTLIVASKVIDESQWEALSNKQVHKYGFPTTELEENLTGHFLIGIKDPLRPGIIEALSYCRDAHIAVTMCTGDNLVTATAIAYSATILSDSDFEDAKGMKTKPGRCLLGKELIDLTGGVICSNCKAAGSCKCKLRRDVLAHPRAFDKIAKTLKVVARSQPLDKYVLVTGYKRMGEVVAVTGDGANDAPALKNASVGIAMGIAGCEVAKDAAGIILLDDNFFGLIHGVKWGRSVVNKIRKFFTFQQTVNFTAIALVMFSSMMFQASVFSTIQMLWVNMIMDSLGSLALSMEVPSMSILKGPAEREDSTSGGILTPEMSRFIVVNGFFQIIVMLICICAGERFIPETKWTFLTTEDNKLISESVGGNQYSKSSIYSLPNSTVRSGRPQKLPLISDEIWTTQLAKNLTPSRHYTFCFSVFIAMSAACLLSVSTLTNEEARFFGWANYLRVGAVVVGILIVHVIFIELGGFLFSAHLDGLTLTQWMLSLFVPFLLQYAVADFSKGMPLSIGNIFMIPDRLIDSLFSPQEQLGRGKSREHHILQSASKSIDIS